MAHSRGRQNVVNFSGNNHVAPRMTELRSPLIDSAHNTDLEGVDEMQDDTSVNTDDLSREGTRKRWQLNYQEAAIYLKEGENNQHFNTHPKSQDALPAYILINNIWFYMMDFASAVLLLALALCEKPAVSLFHLDEIIHGSVELFLLTIIAIGLGLKIRWLGVKKFFLHKRTAIKTVVLIVMYCEAITVLVRQQSHFRITRSLRPFFLIDCHYCRGVRRVLRQIFQSLLPILDVMVLLLYFMVIFAILGFFFFAHVDHTNFDSLLDSFVSLFILMTSANSPNVMMPAYNSNRWSVIFFIVYIVLELFFFMNLLLAVVYDTFTKVEKAKFKELHLHKRTGASKAFKLLCSRQHPGKIIFSHFTGLMKYYRPRYSKSNILLAFKTLNTSDTELLTMSEFQEIYEVGQLKWRRKRDQNPLWFEHLMSPLNKPFQLLNWFVNLKIFNYAIYCVLCVNGIVFIYKTIIISDASSFETIGKVINAVHWYDWTFMGIYLAEIVLKVIGLGITQYFSSGWNVFDFVITIIALLGMTIESISSTIYYVVILRPIRLLRLFKIKKRYRDVFGTFYVLLSRMLSVGVVIIVMYYFYAIIGMECFAGVDLTNCCKNTTYEPFFSDKTKFYFYLNNFENILNSYVTLFQLTVVNNWHVIMSGIALTYSEWSRIYFILFYLSSLVVVTIIVTFILEAFVFRMQYGQRNSQADEEFVSSIEIETTLSLQELERFYPTESRNDVQLMVLQNMLRNAPDTLLTFKGSRKRTKADLSKKMYADEIKEWIRQQDETHRQDLRQFLVRQLSRTGSVMQPLVVADLLSPHDESGHDTSDDGATYQQLQTFGDGLVVCQEDDEISRRRNNLPYWEEMEDTPPRVRKVNETSVAWTSDPQETKLSGQLRLLTDDEDDGLIMG